MAEETLTILRVGTEEAVRNINDLKDNIKILKENLGDLEIGTEEYQNTLEELKVNQNALKDAMYATSSTMDDVAKSATGASESYNSLVHRMASLKEEFRATNDEARRGVLGAEIKQINDQLKEMDALQGNFQRNVGNYKESVKEAFKDMSEKVDAFRKSTKLAEGGLNGLKDGMEGISKSPAIATFGILVSVAVKLAGELKKNETAMESVKSAMAALKPVMDFLSGVIEKIAVLLADVISKVADFVSSNGLAQKVVQGVMGIGNAIIQYVAAPFKGVIEAIKVFKEKGVKGLGDAAKAFGAELKSGFSFKQNFQNGQAVAESVIGGVKSKKEDAKEAGKEVGNDIKDGVLDSLSDIDAVLDREMSAEFSAWEKSVADSLKRVQQSEEERLKALDQAAAHQLELNGILVEDEREKAENAYEIQRKANEKKLGLLQEYADAALDRGDLDAYLEYDQQRADLEVEIETNVIREKERLRKEDLKDAEEKTKAQKALLQTVASATSSILGSIADMYESDEENSEKNANRIKALRIAAATVDTLSGAIGAYMMSVATIPPPTGAIVGAVQAAAVTAAGLAQIAQLKNTRVSASAGSQPSPQLAIASAPALPTEVSQVRSVTSASEEDRLNLMARDQRVYILSSDIEAAQLRTKTRVSESSF